MTNAKGRFIGPMFAPGECWLSTVGVQDQESVGGGMKNQADELFSEDREEKALINNPIIGDSLSMRRVFNLVGKMASSDATVLISGESGTGKELVAREIHRLSQRNSRPFVPVNCAAIPEELLETELYGHVRGAFTGAVRSRLGRFQLAHRSTLFLDEVGEMSPKLQVKLLRVLQEREFEPVGSDKGVRVDVRIVAATNCDLRLAIKDGRFRDDLYYRLNVIPLHLPPLRERTGDIPRLVTHFLQRHRCQKGSIVEAVDNEALDIMVKYNWPGNVREVENLVERLVVLNEDGVIRARDLPDYMLDFSPRQQESSLFSSLSLPGDGIDLDALVQEMENRLILQALSRVHGNKTMAADLLRLNRTTLVERMRRRGLGLPPQQIPLPLLPSVRKVATSEHSLTL